MNVHKALITVPTSALTVSDLLPAPVTMDSGWPVIKGHAITSMSVQKEVIIVNRAVQILQVPSLVPVIVDSH
jgi:hypothetical protein